MFRENFRWLSPNLSNFFPVDLGHINTGLVWYYSQLLTILGKRIAFWFLIVFYLHFTCQSFNLKLWALVVNANIAVPSFTQFHVLFDGDAQSLEESNRSFVIFRPTKNVTSANTRSHWSWVREIFALPPWKTVTLFHNGSYRRLGTHEKLPLALRFLKTLFANLLTALPLTKENSQLHFARAPARRNFLLFIYLLLIFDYWSTIDSSNGKFTFCVYQQRISMWCTFKSGEIRALAQ